MAEISVVPIERLELTFAPGPWSFAERRRAEIDSFFAQMQRRRSGVWNGRVLLMRDHEIAGRVLRGRFFETDYASFTAWRAWDCPDDRVFNCFAGVALQAGDGAFVLGAMSERTANAGGIYFPCGTPEPADVVAGAVDLEGNAWRELTEETGLSRQELEVDGGWHAVVALPYIALLRRARARQSAAALRGRILDFLAAQDKPELADIRIVRGPGDLDPNMPAYVRAYLTHIWAGPG
jgi:hypothetical protein